MRIQSLVQYYNCGQWARSNSDGCCCETAVVLDQSWPASMWCAMCANGRHRHWTWINGMCLVLISIGGGWLWQVEPVLLPARNCGRGEENRAMPNTTLVMLWLQRVAQLWMGHLYSSTGKTNLIKKKGKQAMICSTDFSICAMKGLMISLQNFPFPLSPIKKKRERK